MKESLNRVDDGDLLRYTSIQVLFNLALSNTLQLSSPEYWEDYNDRYTMTKYKELHKLTCLLAVCFASGLETFHHWKVFTPGASGVCIVLDRDKLKEGLGGDFIFQEVEYLNINKIRKISPRQLPFVKRKPYQDEKEVRVIFQSTDVKWSKSLSQTKPASYPMPEAPKLPVAREAIRGIILSPFLSRLLAASAKEGIRAFFGSPEIKVIHSSLVESESWKKNVDAIEARVARKRSRIKASTKAS